MATCSRCRADNPPGFRFCGSCGAELAEPDVTAETRKTVTVLFCDVTGSTALGERLDPESLRQVMARYFDAVRGVVERHGGTVEKFIGDAVMAVFGVPRVSEDDALRAVRAAAELRDRLGDVNVELERSYGTTLALRVGVNTGEVVTGTAERLVTGDAVNVAARLEQAAQPGEILIGAQTEQLTRAAIAVEPLGPLELKGKSEGVRAFRLVAVTPGAPAHARRFDVPMVGRERERRELLAAWERVVSEQACVLFTLLGSAGVGKSRLVTDFCERVDATVVAGRCLSYGDGITYWPVAEIVKQLPSPSDAGLDDAGAAAVASLLGDSANPTTPEQIAWGFRKLLEAAAARRPLLVCFDDLQWAEPACLDLIRHVADLSRGAPILLLCSARPELLERAPTWGGGMLNAATVLLEPLSARETEALVASLAEAELPDELRARIRDAAQGNPLFVEEMIAMAAEDADGDLPVPPSIHALLAARIDGLDPRERGVLARGAVEGQVFHLGAVRALAPEEPEPATHVTSLVRKELVRPDQPMLPAEEAYRFRHLLIRDAAYDALPKATRAELHERFAEWLDERGRDLVERDEIVGYHLEQAYEYRLQLAPGDARSDALAALAAQRLAAAGRRALLRHDADAAATLLGRATRLVRENDVDRSDLLADLAGVLFDRGDTGPAAERAAEAVAAAEAAGDERALARARLRQLAIRTQIDPEVVVADQAELVREMIGRVEELADHATLAEAWGFLGRLLFYIGRSADAEASLARSVEEARIAGHLRQEQESLRWWAGAKRYGVAPVEEALAFTDGLLELGARDGGTDVWRLAVSAPLLAMQGRFDDARERLAAADLRARELGIEVRRYGNSLEGGEVENLAGDVQAAADRLREGYEGLGRLGETGFRSTAGTMYAEALLRLGREEDAEAVLRECEAIMGVDDFDPQARMRTVRARILARRGDFETAERLAREALAIMAPTDYLDMKAKAFAACADVFAAAKHEAEAVEALREAVALFERKGDVVSAARTRARLATLRADAPA